VYDLGWSPSGGLVGTGSKTRLRLFSVEAETGNLEQHDEVESVFRFNSIQWTADGAFLFAPTGDSIPIYTVDEEGLRFIEVGRSEPSGVEYQRAALSPDGDHLLACDRDGRVELFAFDAQAPSLTLLDRLAAHIRCTRVSWSPNGRMGLSAGLEGDLHLLRVNTDAGTLAISDTYTGPEEAGDGIWTREDAWAIGGSFGDFNELWYLQIDPEGGTMTVAETHLDHSSGVSAMEFSADGQILLTGGHDHTMHIYTHTPGEGLTLRYDHPNEGVGVHSARFSPDERLVARTVSTIDRLDILQFNPNCLDP